MISEVMAVNFGRKFFERVFIFRPHNVYGPDMGWEHVIPQLAMRLNGIGAKQPSGKLHFPSRARAKRHAAFAMSTTWCRASWSCAQKGEHLSVYHIGTPEEISIADLARRIASIAEREIEVFPAQRWQAVPARCPNI